jgi:hypothetical protein
MTPRGERLSAALPMPARGPVELALQAAAGRRGAARVLAGLLDPSSPPRRGLDAQARAAWRESLRGLGFPWETCGGL